MSDLEKVYSDLSNVFQAAGLSDGDGKNVLSRLIAENWGELPPWSTLPHAKVMDVEKASVGSGVVLTFKDDDGIQKTVMLKVGRNYNPDGKNPAAYSIPGGFMNLSAIEGSQKVPADKNKPENPRIAAAREIEEELVTDIQGVPLLTIDPERLVPMDMDSFNGRGGPMVVQGLMLELNSEEVAIVKEHVNRMASDTVYRSLVAANTTNPDSGEPEAEGVEIFDLADVAAGKVNLQHKDQSTLFTIVNNHFSKMNELYRLANTTTSFPHFATG